MPRTEELSRRRVLRVARLGVLGLAISTAASACAGTPDDPAASAVFHDDLTAVADGPLNGRLSSSGHRWTALGAPGDPAPVVAGGSFGTPPGHVPGQSSGPNDPNPTAAAGYAFLETREVTGRVGAEFRWDASATRNSTLALGALTPVPGSGGTRRMSHMHVSISPSTCAFAVFARGAGIDYTSLVARGQESVVAVLDEAMECDGRTTYRAEVTVDRAASTASVAIGDGEPLLYAHPLIGSVPATTAFWEYYSAPGGANLPRFTRVWADPVIVGH